MKILNALFILLMQTVFSNSFAQLNASNLMVSPDKNTRFVHYSFDFSGTYFRVETTLYKNSISNANRIAYGVREDESEYAPINYPVGGKYTNFMYNPDDFAYSPATKYIIVVNAWEYVNTPGQTITLTYTPPIQTPNLAMTSFQIYSSSSGVKIFDSNTSNNGPQLQKNASYKFKVVVTKSGNAAVNNVRFDLCQYDISQGSYPTVSPKKVETQYLNFGQTHNSAEVTIETSIADFGSNNFIGIAFHLDKDNTVAETNENDNIRLLGTGYHGKMANIGEIIEVGVYDMNGNFIKKLKTTSNDTDFINVKSQLSSGKYILRSNEKSNQVLIK